MNRLLVAVCAAVASLQLAWAGATKYFFVMIPPTDDFEEWMSAVPMLSLDGGATGKRMQAVPDMCGWYSYAFDADAATDNVVLYRDDDDLREDMLGANGNWESDRAHPKTIALSMFFDMGADTVFFVADEEQKTNEDGFYFSTDEVMDFEGTCSYPLAALIYDTDASLHPAFSCYGGEGGGEGCQDGALGVSRERAIKAVQACIGITPNIVESTLDPVTKKPKFNKNSVNASSCFINEQLFNLLFNYQEGVNEKRCYEMPFSRSTDGKWEFDSDFYTSAGVNGGGFYPVEVSGPDAASDALVLADDPTQKVTRAARTKRDAEGPVFYGPDLRRVDPNEDMPIIDILCNGPGWKNGRMDCESLFGDGSVTEMAIKAEMGDICVFGWSCSQDAPAGWRFYDVYGKEVAEGTPGASYNWKGKRNQHFCFESHAKFTYKRGLKLSFLGDDDIWVFIDNRLAVDLGGTHLAAPGYVDLDFFFKGTDIQPGDEKDLDIFFCDRRTTMSNVRIKTNMYIQQKKSITSKETKTVGNKDESSFTLSYTQSGDGSCVSAMSGSDQDSVLTGPQLEGKVAYFIVNGFKATDPIMVDPATGLDTINVAGKYFGNALDLTTMYAPKIDTQKFTPPPGKGGTFSLFVTIGGKAKRLKKWRIVGEVDVVYADAKSYDLAMPMPSLTIWTPLITRLQIRRVTTSSRRAPWVVNLFQSIFLLLYHLPQIPGSSILLDLMLSVLRIPLTTPRV